MIKHQLNLLKLNYLDLYLIHAPWGTVSTDNASFSVDNIYENGFPVIKDFDHMLIWRELEKAVDQGLVRRIGLSNFDELQVDKINSVFNLLYLFLYYVKDRVDSKSKSTCILNDFYSTNCQF